MSARLRGSDPLSLDCGKVIDIEPFDIYPLAVGAKPIDEPVGLLVTRTAKVVSRAFDGALADLGGSLATWLVLVSLAGGLHASQRSIAAAVGVEGPTLTHHLNRMEAEGLVTRVRDPENRRAHLVALTDSGRAQFRSMLTEVQAFDRQLRAPFSTDELATLHHLLLRLVDAATAIETANPPRRGHNPQGGNQR